MFLEPYHHETAKSGWIEVICGSMFSGKTEELIRRINRAVIAKQKISIFKPTLDRRYDEVKVVSHNKNSLVSIPVENSKEILEKVGDSVVVGIDEAQFFDEDLPEVITILANRGIRVILSGLDMDFEGKPFGMMPQLMCIAEFVTKVHAICVCCNGVAQHSFRLNFSEEQVLLGEKDEYEPRCRACFNEGMKEKEFVKMKKIEVLG
ncbi:MAG: thymidine kinase [Bacteroidetes bacterium]|nr:MAG: thymidine kinase [Bacteroidota bacterium]